jgi:hypothetical protein
MQLLIVHEDAEIGEQVMSMLKDSTTHQCDLVESDAAALPRRFRRCGTRLSSRQ